MQIGEGEKLLTEIVAQRKADIHSQTSLKINPQGHHILTGRQIDLRLRGLAVLIVHFPLFFSSCVISPLQLLVLQFIVWLNVTHLMK